MLKNFLVLFFFQDSVWFLVLFHYFCIKFIDQYQTIYIVEMKKILFLILLCFITIACKNKYAIERENEEAALKQKHDSLRNTDVQLSFMNIKVGGSTTLIDSAIAQGKIQIDSIVNGIYVGSVSVPIVKDTTTFKSNAVMRIGTIKEKVASIELYFKSKNSVYTEYTFEFFVKTFCERYYDQHKEKLMSASGNWDHYYWIFKNQILSVDKETHKEVGYGNLGYNSKLKKNEYGIKEMNLIDGISVMYKHNDLYEQLMEKVNKEKQISDSIKKSQKDAEDEQRRIQAEKAKTEYKENI